MQADRNVGKWKFYRDSTVLLWCEAEYNNGKLEGELVSYYEDGKLKRKEIYKDDKSIGGKCFDRYGSEIQHSPFFDKPDWRDKFDSSLYKNLHYPEICRYEGIYGKVLVEFWIDEKGNIETLTLVKTVHQALDAEAMRCVKIALKQCGPISPELRWRIET